MTAKKIVLFAGGLCLIGCVIVGIGMAMMDFDLSRLERNADKYEKINVSINHIATKQSIYLQMQEQDINVVPSPDDAMHLIYYDVKGEREYKVSEEKTDFTLQPQASTKLSSHGLHFFLLYKKNHKAELQLPKDYQGSLYIKNSHGEIHVDGLIQLKGLTCSMSHGDISVKNTNTSHDMHLTTTHGNIIFQSIDANALRFITTHGNIKGQFKGYQKEYQIAYEISHGESNIEKAEQGDKKVFLKTDHGNIDIGFHDEN